MSHDLIGSVGAGQTCDVDGNLYHVIFTNKYVPLDADPDVIKHYWGGASATQNVYIAIAIDEWKQFLDSMRKIYANLAQKHIGKRYMQKAQDWHDLDYDDQDYLSEKLDDFIRDFKDKAIKELRAISPTFNRYALSVREDVIASNAFDDANRDKRLTTVDATRCDFDARMNNTLAYLWNTIAGVSNYREPWNK